MINIFDYINDILYKKRGDLLKDQDAEGVFVPYMVNRWLSMYGTDTSQLINIINKYWNAYETKQQWYKMLIVLLPKCKFKKINYIKKHKEKTKANPDMDAFINSLSFKKEMSKKEILNLISEHNIDVSKYVKKLN